MCRITFSGSSAASPSAFRYAATTIALSGTGIVGSRRCRRRDPAGLSALRAGGIRLEELPHHHLVSEPVGDEVVVLEVQLELVGRERVGGDLVQRPGGQVPPAIQRRVEALGELRLLPGALEVGDRSDA